MYESLFLLLLLEAFGLCPSGDDRHGVFGQGQPIDEIGGEDGKDQADGDADAMNHASGEHG